MIKTGIGLGVIFVAVGAWAQQSEQIASPRPLRDVADRLQAAWARPVTYEEPLWRHSSDASLDGDPFRLNAGPRLRTARLPAEALTNRVRVEDLSYLRGVVGDFNRSNAPLAFAVTERAWGLHIVPTRSLSASGADAPAINVLEELVIVESAKRRPLGHLDALAKAISDKSRVRVEGSTSVMGLGFEQGFAHADSGPEIEWGTAIPVKAREALISLLERSATTMSWRLNITPPKGGGLSFD